MRSQIPYLPNSMQSPFETDTLEKNCRELFCRNEKRVTKHMLLVAHEWETLKL